MDQNENFVGMFPTQRHTAIPTLRCSDNYARVDRSLPKTRLHIAGVVSNEQGRQLGRSLLSDVLRYTF